MIMLIFHTISKLDEAESFSQDSGSKTHVSGRTKRFRSLRDSSFLKCMWGAIQETHHGSNQTFTKSKYHTATLSDSDSDIYSFLYRLNCSWGSPVCSEHLAPLHLQFLIHLGHHPPHHHHRPPLFCKVPSPPTWIPAWWSSSHQSGSWAIRNGSGLDWRWNHSLSILQNC